MYCGNCESGVLSLTVTCSGPVLVMPSTFWKTFAHAPPLSGFICRLRLKTTSSAVITPPSWNFTPERRSKTQVVGSGLVALEARPGSSLSWGVQRIRLSHTLERMVFCG